MTADGPLVVGRCEVCARPLSHSTGYVGLCAAPGEPIRVWCGWPRDCHQQRAHLPGTAETPDERFDRMCPSDDEEGS